MNSFFTAHASTLVRRIVAIVSFFLLFELGAKAVATGKYSLVVHLGDGSTQTFLLNQSPVVAFQSGQFIISYGGSDIEFSVSLVTEFSMQDNTSEGISLPQKGELIIRYTGGSQIVIYGAGHVSDISVSALDGKVQPCKISRAEGDGVSVSLDGFQKGVYIVSIGKIHNFKIVKK